MLTKIILVILLSLILVSCATTISQPTETSFSETKINGKQVKILLNDGSSEQIKVDFYNKKGIYGSRKGYEWDHIQKITFDKNSGGTNKIDCIASDNSCSSNSITTTIGDILVLPIIIGGSAIAFIWYYTIICTTGECNP